MDKLTGLFTVVAIGVVITLGMSIYTTFKERPEAKPVPMSIPTPAMPASG